jgi:sulfate permease, SulP family
VLGAIVIVAVRSFFRVSELRRYWRLQRSALVVVATALGGVLVFDPLPGLLMAVILSLLWYIWWAAKTKTSVLGRMPLTSRDRYLDISRHPEAIEVEGALIVRPDGQLFFGNAKSLRSEIVALVAERHPHVVILDLEFSEAVGLALSDTLRALQPLLDRQSVAIWLTGLHTLAREELTQLGRTDGPNAIPVYDEVADAVAAFTGESGSA